MDSKNIPLLISAISALVTMISVSIAAVAFYRQQRISRLQNILTTWQRFSNTEDFIKIFAMCDKYHVSLNDSSKQQELANYKTELVNVSTEKKYKYLALLEEIAVFSKNDKLIKDTALHLFKFHFFYVYGNHIVSDDFWTNIGSGKTEKEKEGWQYQADFAKICIAKIKSN